MTSNGTCIIITVDDIIVDGSGHSITGNTSGSGVLLQGVSNVTLTNLIVINFSSGVFLNNTNHSTLCDGFVSNNNFMGVYLYHANNNTIRNQTVSENNYGISLSVSDNNTIASNTANSNAWSGIYPYLSDGNTIRDNIANYNNNGIYLLHSDGNTIYNNTANNSIRDGFYASSTSEANTLTSNVFCANNMDGSRYYDISDGNASSGDNNTCDTTSSYADLSAVSGCVSSCGFTQSTSLALDWNLISITVAL